MGYEEHVNERFNELLGLFREKYGLKKEVKIIICEENVIRNFMEQYYPIKRETPSALSVHYSDDCSEIYIWPSGLNRYYGFNNKKLLKCTLLHELIHCIQPNKQYDVNLNEKQAIYNEEWVDFIMEKDFPEEMKFYKKIRKKLKK